MLICGFLKMQVTQEIQISLRDERDMQKTQQIVLEREELIKNIQNKNSAIRFYMENMKSAKFVV